MGKKEANSEVRRFACALALAWFKGLWSRLLRAIRIPTFARGSAEMRELLVPRCLCPHHEWERMCENEYYRMSGIFREHLPQLEQILQNEPGRIMFLGGPGMGLSSLARQIQLHLGASAGTRVAIASLKAFAGNLSRVLASEEQQQSPPGDAVWYLLDDLDSVDESFLPQLMADLDRMAASDPSCHIALFCKQGYASVQAAHFNATFSRYCLLGLTTSDIQRVCDGVGIDAAGFDDELHRLDLGVEAGNPAVLQTLIQLYRRHGRFPGTRKSVFEAILQNLTASIGVVGGPGEESLRALGLAMELASRNCLLPQEAELAIGARTDISPPDAAALLRRIAPFLLFTPEGIWFPHHSFGEYFAASALRDRPLSIILDSVFFSGTRIPNPSWKSALAFLAETHSALRRYLTIHHPDLALAASLSVLSQDERTMIARRLYTRLCDRSEPLARHPEISAGRLAQCLPAAQVPLLEDDARQRINSTLACNAFLLMGEAGLKLVLPLAMATALDCNTDRAVRDSALHAIGCLGSSALIPQLIAGIDRTDPCHVSMLISISRLCDEKAIPTVMNALLSTQTHIHTAYERLRHLQPKPTALALLDMVRQQPGLMTDLQWRFYASCLPAAIRRGWDAEVAAAAVDVLTAIEEARVLDLQNDFMEQVAGAIADRDREEFVVRQVCRHLGGRHKPVTAIPRTLLRLSSPRTIRWLLSENYDERFLISLRMYARRELYQIFEELGPRPTAQQDPQLAAWEREHRARLEEAEASVKRAHQVVRQETKFEDVFKAVIFLGEDRLPSISPERVIWLEAEVNAQFAKVDFSAIKWEGTTCSIPSLLYCLVLLVRQYELHLADDVPLIKSLNSLRGEAAEVHSGKFGLSAAAQTELERLIADPNLNPSAVHTVLNFIRQTGLWTPGIAAALQQRALGADPLIQGTALFVLCAVPQSTDALINIASQKNVPVPDSVTNELVKRQHRPTIERRLSQLLNDKNLLASGEVEFPSTSPLDWIGDIRLPEVWKKLLKLRGLALQLGHSRLVGTITGAMAKIDEARLASSMAGQVAQAPKAWQPWQQTRVLESRQRARLAQARSTEFRRVVAKLQIKSTNKLLKIWCEGVTDLPALRSFVKASIGERDDVVLQPIGGWGELSNPNWPLERLWDGCLDVIVVADGDNGRDWNRTDRPLSDAGKALIKRLTAVGITGFVLNRYGLENYFSTTAVEAVLGTAVGQHFPLADSGAASAVVGYSKDSNGAIAERMILGDLKGTDLYDILEEVRQRVDSLTHG